MTDAAFAEPGPEVMEAPAPRTSRAVSKLIANIKAMNIADDMDDGDLTALGSKVCEEAEIDEQSRNAAGWSARIEAALKLAMQVKEAKTYPWPGASNIKYPLIITAAIQFNARAYPAIVDGWNVAKGKVLGKPSPEKQERADRIGRHMSYQLLEQMDGWEEETDRMLVMLPILGSVFRKTYFDPYVGHNCSKLVTPEKLIVNYWAKDLDSAPRVTQLCEYYPYEIEEKIRAGLWLEHQHSTDGNDEQSPVEYYEQHRLWDLDGDGYPEPYIVTVHKENRKVVRVVARYDEDGIRVGPRGNIVRIIPVRYFTKFGFIPSPDGSFYDVGFGTLLEALNETINSTLNQLMDSGHLANTQGGFIGAGVTLKSGAARFMPGEWKKVEATGQALKDNLVPLQFDGPSTVLFQLLGMLIDSAKEITATKDILTGDTGGQQQAVGTTLALIEQGLKVFTAIYKRIHRSLKGELNKLYRLNRVYLEPEEYFNFQDQEGVIAQADYADDGIDVIPVSDPSVVTDMQRVARGQFLLEVSRNLPGVLDPKVVADRALSAAGIEDIEGLFPKEQAKDPALMLQLLEQENEKARIGLEQFKAETDRIGKVASAKAAEATARKTTLEAQQFGDVAEAALFVDLTAGGAHQPPQQGAMNGDEQQVRPGDVSQMEGPGVEPPVSDVPGGPPRGIDEAMGDGGEPGGPGAAPGPPV